MYIHLWRVLIWGAILLHGVSVFALDKVSTAKAHQVITYQCGTCHTGSLPTANKGALRIFDLDDKEWFFKISGSQKEEMIRRLEQRVTMSDLEVSYLMPKRPSKVEISLIRSILTEAELESLKN